MKQKGRKKAHWKVSPNWKWIATIFASTMGISAAMSLFSTEVLNASGMGTSLLILLCIVFIGIIFDIIGVAVTAADEKPFHAMASKKIPEAALAISMLRKADRVSSFCNDVVGDICGVISGSASAVIAARAIVNVQPILGRVIQLLMSALVAAITVGGKAFGKSIAMNNSTMIIHFTARLFYVVKTLPKRLSGLFRRH